MRLYKTAMFAALIATLSVTALMSRAGVARAEDICAIKASDLDTITAIQNNPSLSADQETVQELAARRQLVGQTIACAKTHVAALRTTLNNATATGNTQNIKSQLLSSLDGATSFYTAENAKFPDAGIAGMKAIAREIIVWREGIYAPLEGEVSNYLLWTQNQPLFETAQTRMDQTQQAVAFLESAAADKKLQDDFNAAYAAFQTAKQQNAAARTALAQNAPPDQSVALIKLSLDSLSSTYQGFFSVSDDIKKLLPH